MEHRARPNTDKITVLRFRDRLMPTPVPTYANPAIGNQRMCPSDDPVRPNEDAPVLIVSLTVALPLESKVTEFELSEHVGVAAACAGCTVQASDTGWLNALSKLRLTVEVAL